MDSVLENRWCGKSGILTEEGYEFQKSRVTQNERSGVLSGLCRRRCRPRQLAGGVQGRQPALLLRLLPPRMAQQPSRWQPLLGRRAGVLCVAAALQLPSPLRWLPTAKAAGQQGGQAQAWLCPAHAAALGQPASAAARCAHSWNRLAAKGARYQRAGKVPLSSAQPCASLQGRGRQARRAAALHGGEWGDAQAGGAVS